MQLLKLRVYGDYYIWIVLLSLSTFSILFASTSIIKEFALYPNIFYQNFFKHLFIIFIGLIITYVFHRIKLEVYYKYSLKAFFFTVIFLVVASFFGQGGDSVRRWVEIPLLNMTFQPSEFAEIALIVYLASMLRRKQIDNQIKTFFVVSSQFIFYIFLVFFLIFLYNFSNALLIFSISIILLFVGRANVLHIIMILLSSLVVVLSLFAFDIGRGHIGVERFETFWQDKSVSENYQSIQALQAISNSSLTGTGLGKSMIHIPEKRSDYIFAHIIEEGGIIMGLVCLGLYLLFFYRCFLIIKKQNAFSALVVIGLSMHILQKAFIHIGVNLDLLPVTGMPLPLISMGGSSMIATYISMGIILAISASKDSLKEKPKLRLQNRYR